MTSSTFLSCPFKMLSAAAELAFDGDFQASSMFINMARDLATETQEKDVSILAACVSSQLAECIKNSTIHEKNKHTEFSTVQYWFKRNYESVIADSIIKNDISNYRGKYRPDFYVIVDGEKRPVECKKTFNERALNQLNTYMKVTNAKIGYAVAFSLKCNLPENVIFIQCPLDVLHSKPI